MKNALTIEFAPRWNRDGEISKWIAAPTGNPEKIIDTVYGDERQTRVAFNCEIEYDPAFNYAKFVVMTCGQNVHGCRYRRFETFTEAIECAEKWAAGRFRFMAEQEV